MAHQSATPGTISSAIWLSVAALSSDEPRIRPASAMRAASVTSSGSRIGASNTAMSLVDVGDGLSCVRAT